MFRIDRNVEDKSRKAKLIDSEVSSVSLGGSIVIDAAKYWGNTEYDPACTPVSTLGVGTRRVMYKSGRVKSGTSGRK